MSNESTASSGPRLRRTLTLWNLIIIGIVIIQPIAPMGMYGIVNNAAGGHVVTTILIAMVAMLFTAISYGMMARVYPSAGSAYTYVGQEIHPGLGYLTGWAMVMDYILNPLICTILCSKLTQNIVPGVPYWALAIFYATAFTVLNLRGVKTSARINDVLAAGMTIVVIVFFGFVIRFLAGSARIWCGIFFATVLQSGNFQFEFHFSRHFDRGADVYRLRRDFNILGRSGKPAAKHPAGHRAGLRGDGSSCLRWKCMRRNWCGARSRFPRNKWNRRFRWWQGRSAAFSCFSC